MAESDEGRQRGVLFGHDRRVRWVASTLSAVTTEAGTPQARSMPKP